jgi:glutamate carboxypeptidase
MTFNSSTMVADLRTLVLCESPTSDPERLEACADLLVSQAQGLGLLVERTSREGFPVLFVGERDAPVLILGHLDTVHPLGTLTRNPWSEVDGRVTGPGVLDMKSGLVIALHVLAQTSGASLLITSDEEIGSGVSRPLIEEVARRARAVFVLESAVGRDIKIARKGVGRFRLTCRGRAAHAGVEPHRGANALVGLAELVSRGAALGDSALETTVTPTVASAGSSVNTVPDLASVVFDVRAWTSAEFERIESALSRELRSVADVTVLVERLSYRPPFEKESSVELLRAAKVVADLLEIPPFEGVASGGGSDGNFTAALGVPTLDGLGAVGAGAHTDVEWVSVDSLEERARLLKGLIEYVTSQENS